MAVTYKDGILYVDNTILTTYKLCELKAAISYGLDLRLKAEDNANLMMGKAGHKALEHYYQGVNPADCMQIFQDEYREWADKNIFDNKRLGWPNIERVFQSWMTKNPQDKVPFDLARTQAEIPFEVPLSPEGDIIFTGTIDLLTHSRHGNMLYAIDHKFTSQVDNAKEREHSLTSQMSGYTWALKQLGHEVTGIYINFVHTGVVPTSARKCTTHRTLYEECGFLHMNHKLAGPYSRSDYSLKRWYRNALAIAKKWRTLLDKLDGNIDNLKKVPTSGEFVYQACVRCPWNEFCKLDQKTYWLTNNTIVDPWFPGTLAER